MASPLLLAGAAFFTIIIVGSLLVGVNDWLAAHRAGARVGFRRDLDHGAAITPLGRSPVTAPRGVARSARATNGRPREHGKLLVDFF
ncbi:MAG: hypothetical protein WD273_10550 [Trueperaceae bacterium]